MREFDFAKYLRKNPPLPLNWPERCRHAVVIPVYNELSTFAATDHAIRQAYKNTPEKIAVIAVINYPPGADKTESEKLYNLIRIGVFPGVVPISREKSWMKCDSFWKPHAAHTSEMDCPARSSSQARLMRAEHR